ncbi:MAG: phosphoadenylyl-sulfate reductase [Rhizobacter sp.]|nr:phosphoadenylyl-sulfate reductase [Ferruginibacter sp.]
MTLSGKELVSQLIHQYSGLSELATLSFLADHFAGQIVFSSSFSFEDQVISHQLLSNKIPVSIFTLDTGRLFSETYAVWNSSNEKYQTKIKAYYPSQEKLQAYVEEKGPNAFYESIDNRKECCFIRKVEPLQRALAGNKLWVTGLRAEHSAARHDLPTFEWDETNQIIKYHPLLHWTFEEVKDYITKNNIPYNPLHDRGFVSIGCAPCTRAVKPGEDFRAGRWWWEDANKKECGLHATN